MKSRLHGVRTRPFLRLAPRAGLTLATLAVLLAPTLPVASGQALTPLDPPDLGCPPVRGCFTLEMSICGGGWGGAPGGFTIQWQKRSDWDVYGWPAGYGTTSDSPSFCTADFEGPQWQLGQYECTTLTWGTGEPWPAGVTSSCPNDPLMANTEYVFRAYAHATPNMTPSPWGGTLRCSTEYSCPPEPPEGEGCTFTVGYWKNHGPGSRQGNEWPVDQLPIGAVVYTDEQLMQILRRPTRGNGLVSLARQLIAAKLNIAAGASNEEILDTIQAADMLIGSLVVPPIGDGYLHASVTSDLTDDLTAFNEGDIGPGHCDD